MSCVRFWLSYVSRCSRLQSMRKTRVEKRMRSRSPIGQAEDDKSDSDEPETHIDGEVFERVREGQWVCDVCFECFPGTENPWTLAMPCTHNFCRACLRGCIGWRNMCPYDCVEIPLLVWCGVFETTTLYLAAYKEAEARRLGGIPCVQPTCPGATVSLQGEPVSCNSCGAKYCGKRTCASLWIPGHECGTNDVKALLSLSPPVRACPGCGIFTEKVDGCDIVVHDACNTTWCFACGKVSSGSGCTHGRCQGQIRVSASLRVHKNARRSIS